MHQRHSKKRRSKTRDFPWRCPRCGHKEVYREPVSETRPILHDGRLHKVRVADLRVPRCRACGELLFDNEAHEQSSAALRTHLHLLQPEQIRTNRRGLGLTQAQLGKTLAWPRRRSPAGNRGP